MKNRNIIMIIAALCMVIMGACFSPWDGSDDQGSIVINVGNGGARAVAGVTEYTITLANSGETSISQTTTGGTVVFPVLQPGPWNILVRAKGLKDNQPALLGYGEADVEVKARAVTDVTITVIVTDATDVVSTWNMLDIAFQTPGNQKILITNNLNANKSIETVDKKVTLLAEKPVIITKTQSTPDSLFRVTSGSTLTLGVEGMRGSITIDGGGPYRAGWNSSLIYVGNYHQGPPPSYGTSGGTLEMYNGVILKNNYVKDRDDRGGAVVVDGGTFNMYGGEISGNSSPNYGGGVRIMSGRLSQNGSRNVSGVFIKTGGIIKDNIASTQGQAIYVDGVGKYKNDKSEGGGIRINTGGTGEYVGLE